MGFWLQFQKNAVSVSDEAFGSDTDTEIWFRFWFPMLNFGRTLTQLDCECVGASTGSRINICYSLSQWPAPPRKNWWFWLPYKDYRVLKQPFKPCSLIWQFTVHITGIKADFWMLIKQGKECDNWETCGCLKKHPQTVKKKHSTEWFSSYAICLRKSCGCFF